MTQQQALLNEFKRGKSMSWIQAFYLTGTSKLATRVSDFKKLGFKFIVEKRTFQTRFGTSGYYFIYKLDLENTDPELLGERRTKDLLKKPKTEQPNKLL